jgi:hypothetical protein
VVYASWRDGDRRLPFLCQVGVGLPSMPALFQALREREGEAPSFPYFMARPRLGSDQGNPPTLDRLQKEMNRYFEFGTVYTMIAGLLNVLAIYDAWGGPVFPEAKNDEQDDDEAADGEKREQV